MRPCLLKFKLVVFIGVFVVWVSSSSTTFRRVCYFTNWSCDLLEPEAHFCLRHIDPKLCTHFVYAFAQIDPVTFTLTSTRKDDEDNNTTKGRYRLFNELVRNGSHEVKTLLSIGGLNQSEASFRAVSRTPRMRTLFAHHCALYLRRWGFDGLDVDWEYPQQQDKQLLSSLLKALRAEFQEDASRSGDPQLLLSVAAPVSKHRVSAGYDVSALASQVDMINLMAYDFHGAWSDVTGVNSPLYPRHSDSRFSPEHSVEWSVKQWLSLGASPSKINLGIAGYGQSYTLKVTNEGQGHARETLSQIHHQLSVTSRKQESLLSPSPEHLAGDRPGRQTDTIRSSSPEINRSARNEFNKSDSIRNNAQSSRSKIRRDMILSVDKPVQEINKKRGILSNQSISRNYGNQRDESNTELGSLQSGNASTWARNDNRTLNTSSKVERELRLTPEEENLRSDRNEDSNTQVNFSEDLDPVPSGEIKSKQNKHINSSIQSADYSSLLTVLVSSPESLTRLTTLKKREDDSKVDLQDFTVEATGLPDPALMSRPPSGIGTASRGPGTPGRLRHLSGQLSYPEICELIGQGGREFWDEEQQVPYVTSGNQWVGYDNPRSIAEKVRWAMSHQLGGVMFWSLDLDDFKGDYCGQGRYPLLSAITATVNSLLQASPTGPGHSTFTRMTSKEPGAQASSQSTSTISHHQTTLAALLHTSSGLEKKADATLSVDLLTNTSRLDRRFPAGSEVNLLAHISPSSTSSSHTINNHFEDLEVTNRALVRNHEIYFRNETMLLNQITALNGNDNSSSNETSANLPVNHPHTDSTATPGLLDKVANNYFLYSKGLNTSGKIEEAKEILLSPSRDAFDRGLDSNITTELDLVDKDVNDTQDVTTTKSPQNFRLKPEVQLEDYNFNNESLGLDPLSVMKEELEDYNFNNESSGLDPLSVMKEELEDYNFNNESSGLDPLFTMKEEDNRGEDLEYPELLVDVNLEPGADLFYYTDEIEEDMVNDYFYYIAFKRDLPKVSSSGQSHNPPSGDVTPSPTLTTAIAVSGEITETPVPQAQQPRTGGNYVAFSGGCRCYIKPILLAIALLFLVIDHGF